MLEEKLSAASSSSLFSSDSVSGMMDGLRSKLVSSFSASKALAMDVLGDTSIDSPASSAGNDTSSQQGSGVQPNSWPPPPSTGNNGSTPPRWTIDPTRPTTFPLPPTPQTPNAKLHVKGWNYIRVRTDMSFFNTSASSSQECSKEGDLIPVGINDTSRSWPICNQTVRYRCYLNCSANDVVTADVARFVFNDVIPTSLAIIESIVMVPTRDGPLQLNRDMLRMSKGKCGPTVQLNSTYGEKTFDDTDLLLFVTLRPIMMTSVIAFGTPCNFDFDDHTYDGRVIFGRPLAGSINLSPMYMNSLMSVPGKYGFQKAVQSTVHELIHVLGFTQNLYTSFLDKNGVPHVDPIVVEKQTDTGINGQPIERFYTKMKTPHLVNATQRHFNCPSCDGLEMENKGAKFSDQMAKCSHWDSRTAYSELMNPTQSSPIMTLSVLTLAFLQDMGWYVVDMRMAQEFHWGENEGCQFLNGRCENWKDGKEKGYFCDNRRAPPQCTADLRGIGNCNIMQMKVNLSDISPYYVHYPNPYLGGPNVTDYCAFIEMNIARIGSLCTDHHSIYSRCFMVNTTLSPSTGNSTVNGTSVNSMDNFRNETSQVAPRCYETKCEGEALFVRLIGSEYVACPSGAVIQDGSNSTVTCPMNNLVCGRPMAVDIVVPHGSLLVDSKREFPVFVIPVSIAGGVVVVAAVVGGLLFKKYVLRGPKTAQAVASSSTASSPNGGGAMDVLPTTTSSTSTNV
ncbi:hypothetical protein SAMD00019534_004000 [Acytostelium subglobosum LB1]|uniref:hypothetical protein n=1 Tax=Acytostelium subglobosum LB1 TaxID=1410327 RepID=UPI000644B7B0|nr:hypothetical protein SAMD00019534_004000 [Acytostelium subglobosum LB1]GAM17225.1 hypothetical protein SAMD00019534_004000 [Acytostelium subglobosum LB1]|eukprot:XP_012759287.1 hypothetical protein SAMD00019534_004000 [Acytostelium subglobosum LB1]